MPLFLSEEEFCLISNDAAMVAERADAFIRDIRMQLDVVRAEADAKSIAVEQNCAIIEQKYAALSLEFLQLQSENAQLSASNEKQLSELAEAKAEKHHLHIKEASFPVTSPVALFVYFLPVIGKDGEIERLSLEVAELRKSRRHFLDLVEQKDAEIRERDTTIQSYINKIGFVWCAKNVENVINEICDLLRYEGVDPLAQIFYGGGEEGVD
ncbi:hypothetical protein HPP92_016739 [Vanilla planifolia]|uniref:Uncharacterized protein n=1 Tax=Vanilla planifolia TaxID=51239 RepID=A0A835USD0_VANPL|nr:hypothetical protein HPP92_016739 [Vanilla planifolia]